MHPAFEGGREVGHEGSGLLVLTWTRGAALAELTTDVVTGKLAVEIEGQAR